MVVVALSYLRIPTTDVVVDTRRGFVLQRVGTYSRRSIREVLHTFVPLHGLCASSPTTEICIRASSLASRNSVTLGSTMPSSGTDWMLDGSTEKDVIEFTEHHINQLLSSNSLEEFAMNLTSSFHFFNGEFYVSTESNQCLDVTCDHGQMNKDNSAIELSRSKRAVTIILEQLQKKRIGFEFLTSDEIDVFLSPIMTSIDRMYNQAKPVEKMNDFLGLARYQTVTAFHSCSWKRDIQRFIPCLLVSTFFAPPSLSDEDTYSVYDIFPLPVISDGYEYTYHMPSTIGFNAVDQSVIVWNRKDYMKCTFKKIVQCVDEQTPITVNHSPCLRSLFLTNASDQNNCATMRTSLMEPEIRRVSDDIWVFNNVDDDLVCQQCSTKNQSHSSLSIDQSALVRLPCDTELRCEKIRIRASNCYNRSLSVNEFVMGQEKNNGILQIPLTNLGKTLVSHYHTRLREILEELDQANNNDRFSMARLIKKFADLLILGFVTIVLIIIMMIIRCVKIKFQRQLNQMERQVNKMSDIYLEENICS